MRVPVEFQVIFNLHDYAMCLRLTIRPYGNPKLCNFSFHSPLQNLFTNLYVYTKRYVIHMGFAFKTDSLTSGTGRKVSTHRIQLISPA
jgi:hypothetical protein